MIFEFSWENVFDSCKSEKDKVALKPRGAFAALAIELLRFCMDEKLSSRP
jgi:hypothetical protein